MFRCNFVSVFVVEIFFDHTCLANQIGREKAKVIDGIAGHYCWMAMISRTSNDRGAVKIGRKPVPPKWRQSVPTFGDIF